MILHALQQQYSHLSEHPHLRCWKFFFGVTNSNKFIFEIWSALVFRHVLPFSPFKVDLKLGKIFNIREESEESSYLQSHKANLDQIIHFLPLTSNQANLKEPYNQGIKVEVTSPALVQAVFHVGDRFLARKNRCPKN